METIALKILLLEDSAADAEIIRRIVNGSNPEHIFKTVITKEEYTRALDQFQPNVVLSDNALPQFNATEALQILQQQGLRIPFILVTGTVSEEFAANIIKSGADDYLLKDRLARLPVAIEAAVKQRQAEKEKQEATEKLKQNEEKYRNLIERVSDAFVALDNNWCYTYVNKRAGEIMQRIPEEVIGKNIWVEFPESIGNNFHKAYTRAMEEQRYIHLEEYYANYDIWLENHIYPSPEGLSIYFRDITEKKKIEKKLAQNEKRFRALLENNEGIISLVDEKLNVLFRSSSATRIFGWTVAENEKISPSEYVHTDDLKNITDTMIEAGKNSGKMFPISMRVKHKNGNYIWVEGVVKNMIDDPAIGGIITNMRDVTERKVAEENFLKEQQLSETIINNLPGIFYLYDEDGKFIRWNKNFENITGYTGNEISKMAPLDFYDNDEQEKIKRRIKTVFERRVGGIEVELFTKNKSKIPYYINSLSVQYEGKKCLLGMGLDLTERKKAEEAIKRANERYEMVSLATNDAVHDLDFITGENYFNEALSQLFNKDETGSIKINRSVWRSKLHPEDRERVVEKLEAAYAGTDSVWTDQFRFQKADLTYGIFYDRGFIRRDASGKATGIITSMTDITKLKEIEQQLKESEEKYRTLIEQASDAIFISSIGGNILDVNNSACTLLGYTKEKLCTMKVKDQYSAAELAARPIMQKELLRGERTSIERNILHSNGLEIPVDITAKMLSDGRIVAIMRDISERKKAERELNEERNKFAKIAAIAPGLIYSFRLYTDGTYGFPYASNAIEDVFGFKHKDVEKDASCIFKLSHPDDLDAVIENISASAQNMSPWKDEFRYLHPVKGEVWLEGHSIPMIEVDGSVIWHGIITDITKRKIGEQKLREQKVQLETLSDNLPGVMIYQVIRELDGSMNFTYLSSGVTTLTGKTPEEVIANPAFLYNIIVEEDKQILKAAEHESFLNMSLFNIEVRSHIYTGEIRWLNITSTPHIHPDGRIVWDGFHFDITEHKNAEAKIKESEEKYRQIVETAQEGVWLIDENSNTTFVNEHMAKMLGYTTKEVEGKHLFEFMDDEAKEIAIENIERRKQGIKEQHDFAFKTKEGKTVWTLVETNPVLKNGKYAGALAMVMDITERKKSEEEIKKSIERFQLLGQATNDAVWEWNLNTNSVWSNLIHQQLYGLTLNDTVPDIEEWKRRVHPEEREQIYQSLLDAQNSDSNVWFGEYQFNSTSKGWINIFARAYIKRNEEGKAVRMVGSMMDITERKKAETIIRLSEEKYRSLVEQASDAIFIADVNGRFITVNSSACKLSQYSEQELLQMTIYDFAVKEDIEKNPFHFDELRTGKTVFTERQVKRKNDSLIYAEINSKLLSDGRLLTFVRDISERKKSQQALVESENHLRTILETEPECIKLLNINGELESMNPAGLAMLEADSLEQLQGMSILSIINEPYRNSFLNLIKKVFDGESEMLEFEVTGLKGTQRWFETHSVPLRNAEGKIISLLGVTRDITERKKATEEIKNSREQLRHLTAHLQNIREEERKRIGREIHDELGQQLTAIKMYVAWIDKKTPVESVNIKNRLENILELLDGSNQSLRRILSELRPGILDDYGLIDGLEFLNRQFAITAGINVEFNATEIPAKMAEEINTCIFRIYQEALTNITKYADAKKVTSSLRIMDDIIIVSIEDDGNGFEPENVQNNKSFGLLGMKERVYSLNGTFNLISSPGNGTKISILLPYVILQHT
jgi:PAS domain S-box-containing protein